MFNENYYPPMIFGGIGCPVSPPVSPGVGCTIFGVVSSPPQLEVLELEGFENNPINIKNRLNICKNLKIGIRVLPRETDHEQVYTVVEKRSAS